MNSVVTRQERGQWYRETGWWQVAHAVDLIRSSLVITAGHHGAQQPEVSYGRVIAGTDSRPGLLALEQGRQYQWHYQPGNVPIPLGISQRSGHDDV